MRLLSFILLLTLSGSSAASDSKSCIQGGKVPDECPNNYQWNAVSCRFECAPHCVSNEGKFVFPDPTTGSASFSQLCNACNCKPGGVVGICTKMACDSSKCWDDSGKSHEVGDIVTSGCKTGTCTLSVDGKGVWSWYDPSSAPTKPNCPLGTASFNKDTCQWDCPSTCDDGSSPAKCLVQPCALAKCGSTAPECVDNYCPNFPVNGKGPCTSSCVKPVLCAKDPCQSPVGQPKCGKNQICEADYRFGCGYQCKEAPTCDFNGKTYHVGESRPSADGCNTCSCTVNDWVCTERFCPKPTDKPICPQGGKVPDECPNNYKWNDVTCRFECLPHCISNEGNLVLAGEGFKDKCNKCTCGSDGSAICTKIGCDNSQCYDDTGKSYTQGATIKRGCKTATCGKDSNAQGVWKWVNPAAQQPPRCDLSPATFDSTTCKWTCSKTCADGSNPPLCLVNPCAATLCLANTQCVVNNCPNYPNPESGACTATCQPINQCFVSPCSVNSCGKGQTCVDDYVGGCNYRCKDKYRM